MGIFWVYLIGALLFLEVVLWIAIPILVAILIFSSYFSLISKITFMVGFSLLYVRALTNELISQVSIAEEGAEDD